MRDFVAGRRVRAVVRRVPDTHAVSYRLASSSKAAAQTAILSHVYYGPGHRERAVMKSLISLSLDAVGRELRLVVDGGQRVDADERVNGGQGERHVPHISRTGRPLKQRAQVREG